MNIFAIGQKVTTEHGTGIIVDKELANNAYPNQAPVLVTTGRYGVKLDEGHTWAIKGKVAYYQPHEITVI